MRIATLPARIAWRYLWAKKSHSAVSAISIVSVVGVAVATAAIICVLSVFNGFKDILTDTTDLLAPDILVTPAWGKTFADADSMTNIIGKIDGVKIAMPAVIDNALALYDSREMPVTLRGIVPKEYSRMTAIDSLFVAGSFFTNDASDREVAVSVGVAQQLGIGAEPDGIFLFAPKREGRVNMANPMNSFLTDSVGISGTFQSLQHDIDENSIICDISIARNLFQYTTEATAIEIETTAPDDLSSTAARIRDRLGASAIVKDRYQQQEANYRMVSIEKWVTFLLLSFILMIASFNIISTLCMLILEKQSSMSTLIAMGMTRRQIGMTFWWESIYVSTAGGVCGVVIGLALSLIQQHFGIIKLSGDPSVMIITAYPVVVEWTDILVAFLPVMIIGLATASISDAYARSRAAKL